LLGKNWCHRSKPDPHYRRGWTYIFYVIAGASIVPIVLGLTVVPNDSRWFNQDPNTVAKIDWLGGTLVTAALCLFTYALTESGITPKGWSAPRK
jgi:hypothetical protein